jgi:hypothetical protein
MRKNYVIMIKCRSLKMKKILCLMIAGMMMTHLLAGDNDGQKNSSWRSAWIASARKANYDDDKTIAAAKELKFNAFVVNKEPEALQEYALKLKKEGIDTYWWFTPQVPKGNDKVRFMQVMPEKDRELLKKLLADKENFKKTYQYGGEPPPGTEQIFRNPLPCLDCKEVIDATKDLIREVMGKCSALTGIAFDAFGYQNYRNCVCGESLRQLGEFRKKNPALSDDAAEKEFSLQSLVAAQNELANFARSLRPDIKTTIHIWPSYMPEPLYGNRLDLDYCAQSVAWFFPPYWSKEKIAKYTRTVVEDGKKYNKRSKGIPFVGIYLGSKATVDKPLEQFKMELETIFENDKARSISIHEFADVVMNPEYYKVLKECLEKK